MINGAINLIINCKPRFEKLTAEATQSASISASHLEKRSQVLVEIGERRVDRHLVLPLELGPHLPELGLGAGRGHDVVHDVDVDVVEDDHVSVGGGRAAVVNNVAEDNAVLRRSYLRRKITNSIFCIS